MSPAKKDSLNLYKKKRNFEQTPEPSAAQSKKKEKELLFVVQKHQASHLHYDFRLEMDGVLVSWAVPKGPSRNPVEKRLAVQTEDHPFDYAYFEGVIPEGNYGAGGVMVWDIGTYTLLKKNNQRLLKPRDYLKAGQIEIVLNGKKLQGGYVLVKLKKQSVKKNWLLIKMSDEYVKAKKRINNRSALSNRTMKQIMQAG